MLFVAFFFPAFVVFEWKRRPRRRLFLCFCLSNVGRRRTGVVSSCFQPHLLDLRMLHLDKDV